MYPSPPIEEASKDNKDLENYYKLRKRLGCLFSHLGGINFYLKICDRLGRYKKKTRYLGIPSGISYNREVFGCSVLEELSEKDFCGYKVNVPKQYDLYLKNLYGSYMEIPSADKREIHVAYKFSL